MKPLLAGVMIASLVSGCAVRTDFIPANGKRLSVEDRIVRYSTRESVAVGEIRNNSGDVVATAYANRDVSHSGRVGHGMQGKEIIDDESFYRIVGDKEAIQKDDEYHARGRTMSIVATSML